MEEASRDLRKELPSYLGHVDVPVEKGGEVMYAHGVLGDITLIAGERLQAFHLLVLGPDKKLYMLRSS